MEDRIDFNGERYLSLRAAAKQFGYTKEYIGQLARSGKVDAKMVDHAWFVRERDLLPSAPVEDVQPEPEGPMQESPEEAAPSFLKRLYARAEESAPSQHGAHAHSTEAPPTLNESNESTSDTTTQPEPRVQDGITVPLHRTPSAHPTQRTSETPRERVQPPRALHPQTEPFDPFPPLAPRSPQQLKREAERKQRQEQLLGQMDVRFKDSRPIVYDDEPIAPRSQRPSIRARKQHEQASHAMDAIAPRLKTSQKTPQQTFSATPHAHEPTPPEPHAEHLKTSFRTWLWVLVLLLVALSIAFAVFLSVERSITVASPDGDMTSDSAYRFDTQQLRDAARFSR